MNTKLDKLAIMLAIQPENEDQRIRNLKRLGCSSSEVEKILGINASSLRNMAAWKEG